MTDLRSVSHGCVAGGDVTTRTTQYDCVCGSDDDCVDDDTATVIIGLLWKDWPRVQHRRYFRLTPKPLKGRSLGMSAVRLIHLKMIMEAHQVARHNSCPT